MGILDMSAYGTILIVFIIFIRIFALNYIPKMTFIVLWEIVIARLLLPISIPIIPVFNKYIKTTGNWTNVKDEKVFDYIAVIWIAGVIFLALFFAINYLRSIKKFKKSILDKSMYISEWLSQHDCYRHIQVKISDCIDSPLTYGIIKPIILLPKNICKNKQQILDYILTHEYIHIRQYDCIKKIILALVLCIHWFNPFVWVMYILANRDIELYCDESVMRIFGKNNRKSYAMALIKMVEYKNTSTGFCNYFSKNIMEERIESIMKYKKASVYAVVCAIVLIMGSTTVFALSNDLWQKTQKEDEVYVDKVDEVDVIIDDVHILGKINTSNDSISNNEVDGKTMIIELDDINK